MDLYRYSIDLYATEIYEMKSAENWNEGNILKSAETALTPLSKYLSINGW
jgi:hypothetical protein